MSRRDRETTQEEQESTEQQEVGTPQNKAKAKAGTRRAKSAGKDSAVVVVATSAADAENNNPLKKVVFVHHVLRFLKQDYVKSDIGSQRKIVKTLFSVPRFIHLRHVSSTWKETVEFYNPRPQKNALTFCHHLPKLVPIGYGKKMKFPSAQGSIVLRDIVGWLSNVEITNISDGDSDSDDDDSFVSDILWYFLRCLDSSPWKKEQSEFEHHAAFVRDTLLWISNFCVFKNDDGSWDDFERWCGVVKRVITKEKGEYFGFDTPEVRDALLSVSKNITTSNIGDRCYDVSKWFKVVFALTHDNEKAQKIFGTKEVLDEFIRLSDNMTEFLSEDSYDEDEIEAYCQSMFEALSAITELKKNVNIFATVALRDRMVRMFKWIDTECYYSHPDSKYFGKLLHNLISTNKSNKKLFAVESVRDAMLLIYSEDEYSKRNENDDSFDLRHRRWMEHIQDNEGACLFFENLLALFEVKPKLFVIDETRKNFVEFARKIVVKKFRFGRWRSATSVSSATIRIFLTALHTMLLHNEKLFFSERIDEFLIKIKTRKALLKGSTTLFSKIERIYAKMKKHLKTEEKEKKDENEDEEHRGEFWCDDCESYHTDYDYVEEFEDLENDYWKSGDYMYWNCYYRESEEEKQTRQELGYGRYGYY